MKKRTFLKSDDEGFDKEIMKDLLDQGLFGSDLTNQFMIIKKQVRAAIEKMLEDADKAAIGERKSYTHSEVFGIKDVLWSVRREVDDAVRRKIDER